MAMAAKEEPLWRCPRCGSEIESQFELCWHCGSDRQGRVDEQFEQLRHLVDGPVAGPQQPTISSASMRWTLTAFCTAAVTTVVGGITLAVSAEVPTAEVAPWWPVGWLRALGLIVGSFSLGAWVAAWVLLFWPLRAVEKDDQAPRNR